MRLKSASLAVFPLVLVACSRTDVAAGDSSVSTSPDVATTVGRDDASQTQQADVASPPADAVSAPADDAIAPADAAVQNDAGVALAGSTCRGVEEPALLTDPATCLVRFATGLNHPRVMAFASNGDLLITTGSGITVAYDSDHDGVSSASERSVFAYRPGFDHGLAIPPDGRWVYASNQTDIYRWAYSPGLRVASGAPQHVVAGMPASAHGSRPLVFDAQGRLHVMVGSDGNLDTSTTGLTLREQIRRFTLPDTLPAAGIAYTQGELVASGMRNDTGLTIDSHGRFWGVENGRDNVRDAANHDIHLDNPGEEINRIDGSGATFFGYPSCWSEGLIAGGAGSGTQHGDTEITTARQSDAWCANTANVRPPALVLPAHWAPLGVVEYTGNVLPADWRGQLVVTSHGSWNHEGPAGQVGRVIARVAVSGDGRLTGFERMVGERGDDGMMREGSWGVRPVDVKQGPDGALYFTDDLGGRVLRIGAR